MHQPGGYTARQQDEGSCCIAPSAKVAWGTAPERSRPTGFGRDSRPLSPQGRRQSDHEDGRALRRLFGREVSECRG